MDDENEQRVYKLMTSEGEEIDTSKGYKGFGMADYVNGDKYEGQYENGVSFKKNNLIQRRQGKGKYTYANGDIFEGTFENNMKIGIGKMKYAKGGYYFGKGLFLT